jgi:hypothetical protein
MPCDSAGAGLIALGAMRKRLEIEGANDRAAHFQRIRTLAAKPEFGAEIFDQRHRGRRRGPYLVDGRFEGDLLWASLKAAPETRVTISPGTARYWKFADEPPVQILDGNSIPFRSFYSLIPDANADVHEENLQQTDSGICLAGRPTGDAATRRAMSGLRFRDPSGKAASLAELLTIHDWQLDGVSRVVFFNTRTRESDRTGGPVRLVLADGDASFLEALQKFPEADVVGVFNRGADREKLEAIGSRMADLAQWFEGDDDVASGLSSVPMGISLSLLRER